MPNPSHNPSRLPLLTHAEVEFRGMNCDGMLRDVSLSGALFAFNQPPGDATLLRPCRLHLRGHPALETTIATFNGLVIHAEEGFLGIKFIGVREAERQALLQLFDRHLVEPGLLDRDLSALLKHFSHHKEDKGTKSKADKGAR